MIYTDLTKLALRISFEAHKNQTDKSGLPYVYHPFHLAEQMDDEISTCVALLHDVAEDTSLTVDDLQAMGFPHEVTDALRLLTHRSGVPYLDYIEAIRQNPVAVRVKLADLAHNSDWSRLDVFDAKAQERLVKYDMARQLLHGWVKRSDIRTIRGFVTPCCDIKVPQDSRFCTFCGEPLNGGAACLMDWDDGFTAYFCRECGCSVPLRDRFCRYCGTPIVRR